MNQDIKTEAFAMASFILQVNTMRALVTKGVLSRDEAVELVDEARRQLDHLIAANRTDRAAMLDRELLDYEAIFRDIDDRAAEDLLRTLRDALNKILDEDAAPEDFLHTHEQEAKIQL
jgi:polyhydroxyalkanoate synthesis regulator phasin